MFSLEKGIYMLGGSTDEGTNVKVELKRPWRGKLSSSGREIHETKHTNMGATALRSRRPRETDPCREGSWLALMGTASITILQWTLGKGVWELGHEQESAPLYVKPEWTELIKAKCFSSLWQRPLPLTAEPLSRITSVLSNRRRLNLCHGQS